ncbi:MAG: transglycosylase domain-containing protein [candidate division KSB1 bacterium]|nr:transglycosylase domain-containing protein [candidate division KSB1 bacterium]MDZ7340673.1 transglycosylase domain-containing protein [candidate division KSB1 bacterium]
MKIVFRFIILVVGIVVVAYWALVASLPDVETIENYRPESTVINLHNFNWERGQVAPVQKYVSLSRISPELRTAVIISEDDTFFGHSGININELKKAFQENWQKKRYARGASTITMQVARNAFLTKKKSIIRKVKEILLAKRLERVWTKQRIFEYYLNIAEWGPNVYGAEAAAYYYFNKPAAQLNLAEATLMAGILPNPIRLNPFVNWSGARRRQARVLRLMRNARLISDVEYQDLLAQEVSLRGSEPKLVIDEIKTTPPPSIFDSSLQDAAIPESVRQQADTTGIIFLPEE